MAGPLPRQAVSMTAWGCIAARPKRCVKPTMEQLYYPVLGFEAQGVGCNPM